MPNDTSEIGKDLVVDHSVSLKAISIFDFVEIYECIILGKIKSK